MFRFKYHLLILAAVVVSASVASVSAESLKCEILQYKLGRLYFDAGEEKYIYPGCGVVLTQNNDTLYTGQIEYSYPGISVSRPTSGLADTLGFAELTAVIEPAAVDSSSRIKLGSYGLVSEQIVRDLPGTINAYRDSGNTGLGLAYTDIGNEISISSSPAPPGAIWDYHTGQFDGFFSASMPPPPIASPDRVISSPAPFIAVLVPNLSKKFNEEGLITTSLYYRFSVPKLWSTFFQGAAPAPMNRLYLSDRHTARSYPYDPDKGQLLLKKYRDRPRKLSIGLLSPRLKEVGDFFADILSREKIKVEVNGRQHKDILLAFCPVDLSRPAMSLRYVYNLIPAMNPESDEIKEILEILNNQVSAAENATDDDTRLYYCQLADRTLQSDLGVFPLFRPTIYFVAEKNLKNARFDESGYLDFSALTKLILPAPEWEEQK
ncbi:MAG: hypothetical protein JSV52_00165 [Candidatus Zixiibacteriota bacterium]|nr:MAG: hypothetical protein JSV52_00165 [candidate division Zixibacteria bacterium]